MRRYWLRVDGSAGIGLGHVMRMTALAEAVGEAGDEVRFVVEEDPVAQQIPARQGHIVEAPGHRSWFSEVEKGDVVVFDGYHFQTDDHLAAKQTGAQVAAFDDLGSGTFHVDVLVNQSMVHGIDYDVPAEAKVLLGPRYACLRKTFRNAYRPEREPQVLLVSMGASDPLGLSPRLADALQADAGAFSEVWILVGPSAEPFSSSPTSRIHTVVDPPDIAALFDAAGAAISASGTTVWELLAAGIPSAVVPIHTNQQGVARTAQDAGAAIVLDGPDKLFNELDDVLGALSSHRERKRLAKAGRELVDGWGAERVRRTLVHRSPDLS